MVYLYFRREADIAYNILVEQLLSQFDKKGWQYQLFRAIVNHRKNSRAIDKGYQYRDVQGYIYFRGCTTCTTAPVRWSELLNLSVVSLGVKQIFFDIKFTRFVATSTMVLSSSLRSQFLTNPLPLASNIQIVRIHKILLFGWGLLGDLIMR